MDSLRALPSTVKSDSFADHLLAAYNATHPTVDEAWWSGFGLGFDHEPANPPREYPAAARDAWIAGYAAGFESAWLEWCEWSELQDARLAALEREHESAQWDQFADFGGAWGGHDLD